ncbi:hypothetical protein G6O69_38855 [Pseudenhygromyxa sp. WMMC2535]|uniref:hypothetical protein n=1 Tax=Pseudenhygromyxa sp. WMMC2535 TaxID=2712867 RepID=UPI0015959987|nr:hypothetical protein [Pseudenhygromyxa sp. WMMC2535]NVB42402.1 hypothetical protein [Pseudenhygromyxa sp. WMMC2535]NVB43819.1 hypothetical protein [Pseudenhygromyxa sp. WMMC2535]
MPATVVEEGARRATCADLFGDSVSMAFRTEPGVSAQAGVLHEVGSLVGRDRQGRIG